MAEKTWWLEHTAAGHLWPQSGSKGGDGEGERYTCLASFHHCMQFRTTSYEMILLTFQEVLPTSITLRADPFHAQGFISVVIYYAVKFTIMVNHDTGSVIEWIWPRWHTTKCRNTSDLQWLQEMECKRGVSARCSWWFSSISWRADLRRSYRTLIRSLAVCQV